MKSLLTFVIILSVQFCWAKFFPGQVTMNDSSIKSGYIEIPNTGKQSKLEFRTEKKGKTEKLSIENVTSFSISKDGKDLFYKAIFLEEVGTFGGLKLSKNKRWAELMHDGFFKIYSVREKGAGQHPVYFFAQYLQQPDNDFASYYDAHSSGGLYFKINAGKITRIGLRNIFKRDCPELGEALKTDEFAKEMEEKGISAVEDYYSANCRK